MYKVGTEGGGEVYKSKDHLKSWSPPDTSIIILAQLFEIGPNLMKGANYH